MKNLLRLALLIACASPALAYRDLETGTFLTRDPAGFVDGPNLYAYVNQNPWTKFDPEGLDAELVNPAVPNVYRYTLRPDLNPKSNPNVNIKGSFITNWNPDYTKECATGAQFTHGTVKKDGVHDVPTTKSWTRGDPVTKDTKPGTMVARGWILNDKGEWVYPSISQDQWRKQYGDAPMNHVGSFEKADKKSVTIQDQMDNKGGEMNSRKHAASDGWYEVNGSKPYDAEVSESAVVPKRVNSNQKPTQQPQQNQQTSPTQSARQTRQQTETQTQQQQPQEQQNRRSGR